MKRVTILLLILSVLLSACINRELSVTASAPAESPERTQTAPPQSAARTSPERTEAPAAATEAQTEGQNTPSSSPSPSPSQEPGAAFKYDHTRIGITASEELGENATKFMRETLIPAVLNREKTVAIPADLREPRLVELMMAYYSQNCLIEYLSGAPEADAEYASLSFKYENTASMTNAQYKAELQKIESAVTAIIEKCYEKDYNRLETLLALYTYITQNSEYDKHSPSVTGYGILVLGKGICMGFAQAFHILLIQLETDEGYIVEWFNPNPKEDDHAWNIVRLNGKWYHFDLTWETGIRYNGGLIYFAMDSVRRDSGVLPAKDFNLSPLPLDKPVPAADDTGYAILGNANRYEFDLPNRRVYFSERSTGRRLAWDTENNIFYERAN